MTEEFGAPKRLSTDAPTGTNDTAIIYWTFDSFLQYAAIARIDHWPKNVFALPGVFMALAATGQWNLGNASEVLLGLVALCFISSSNYIINEVMDAPFDKFHPLKRMRPVPSGRIRTTVAWCEWALFFSVSLVISSKINHEFPFYILALAGMGFIYNAMPLRSKDIVYLDVLTEGINNPIRMAAGWSILQPGTVPPAAVLLGYWFLGCYFMALKRFAEFRRLQHQIVRESYRKSLARYTENSLLFSAFAHLTAASLLIGYFIVTDANWLLPSTPIIFAILAWYLNLSFQNNSPVQTPEILYREPGMIILLFSLAVCTLLSYQSLLKYHALP